MAAQIGLISTAKTIAKKTGARRKTASSECLSKNIESHNDLSKNHNAD